MKVPIWKFSEEPGVIPKACGTDIFEVQDIGSAHCKFPFTYQGKEYHKCTKKDHDKHKYWCALDMDHPSSPFGHNCDKCWKNETYNWGHCKGWKSCGIGEQ